MELFYALHQRSIAKRIMCYINEHFWRKEKMTIALVDNSIILAVILYILMFTTNRYIKSIASTLLFSFDWVSSSDPHPCLVQRKEHRSSSFQLVLGLSVTRIQKRFPHANQVGL